MKKIAILCNSKNYSNYADKIKTALMARKIQAEILFSDLIDVNSEKIFDYDLVYSRLSGLKWTYEIMSHIASNNVKLIPNLEYYRISQNKYISVAISNKFGIKVPITYLISTNSQFYEENLQIAMKIGFPIVLKPLYSSLAGDFCFKIDNRKELWQKMATLFKCHQEGRDLIGTYDYGIIQPLIIYKKLIRSLVIDGKTIASGYSLPENSWKCSVCLNPNIKLYTFKMLRKLKKFNKLLFKAFNGEIMIVDVFETKNGFIFNECNTACGLFNLEQVSALNCADIIADYLIKNFAD